MRRTRLALHGSPASPLAFLLLCLLTAVAALGASATAANADSYAKTTTITSGGQYLLVANITNYPLTEASNVHHPALTALGSPLMNSLMIGTQDFSVSGNILTPTSGLSSWEFTITSAGTSNNGNPGYYIQRGSSYLDVTQGLTGLYRQMSSPITIGSTQVSYQSYFSDPYTKLSSTQRVWYWNGACFYTIFTTDTSANGLGAYWHTDPNGLWSGYYCTGAPGNGWAYIDLLTTPWGHGGDTGDGGSEYCAKYTNVKFYLMGMRPGTDALYDDWYDSSTIMGQVTGSQLYFGNNPAVAASTARYTTEVPSASSSPDQGYESKTLSLYKKDVTYSNVAVNVKLDGSAYSSYSGTIKLTDGTRQYEVTPSSGTATFSSVVEGTYDVYAGGADSGVDLTVAADNAAAVVDFYTLTFGATPAGFATGTPAIAAYTGTTTTVSSGSAVLKGKSVTVTAAGIGADSYAYSWSGDVTGTADSVTISSIAKATTASCTVTGYKNVSITKVTDASVTTQAYSASGVIDLSKLFSIDAHAGAATYTIEAGGTGTGSICDASGTADAAGKYLKVTAIGTFPIRVSTAATGYYNAGWQTNTLTVANAAAITSASSATFVEGTAGSFTVTTTGSGTVALSKTGDLPSGVTFTDNGNGTATIAGTPAAATRGSYALTLTATNGVGSPAQQSFTLSVNAAPAITSAGAATFVEGTAGSFTVTSTGRPTAALAKTGALPTGVTFTDNGNGTATIAGTPAAATRGSYALTISAGNGVGTAAQQSFTLSVDAAPAITSAGEATFVEGTAGSFTVSSAGRPDADLTLAGDLPTGVTFTDNGDGTATIAGTPAASTRGSYSLTITAGNGVGTDAEQGFTLEVNAAPEITSADQVTFVEGEADSFTVISEGRPTAALSVSGTLPDGLTFTDNGDGTATIAGTPCAGACGSYALTVTAANGVGDGCPQAFTLDVGSGLPPVTTVSGVPSGWVKRAVRLTFHTAPGEGSAPVASTEYRIGSGAWKTGTTATVSRQGTTKVAYRSVDAQGHVEKARTCTVRIDSVRPAVSGAGRVVAWQGGKARFRFKVTDRATKTVRATVTVTRYGKLVRKYSLGTLATGKNLVAGVTCNLPAGDYNWRVTVTDPAGNQRVSSPHVLHVYPGNRRP